MDVGGVRGHTADLRDQHREAGVALEEVLDRDVQRPRMGCSSRIALRDHRGVRRQRTGVVGDEQSAARGGDVLDPLDLRPEPVAVEELEQRGVHQALDPLRAAPVVEPALGLDRRQEIGVIVLAPAGSRGRTGAASWRRRSTIEAAKGCAGWLGHDGRFWQVCSSDALEGPGRRDVWRAMDREGVSRFPGAEGRIPNFAGAKLAAERLARHRPGWARGDQGKPGLAPDPRAQARAGAGQDAGDGGAAAARPAPFRLLDPRELNEEQLREAATIKGALRHGG